MLKFKFNNNYKNKGLDAMDATMQSPKDSKVAIVQSIKNETEIKLVTKTEEVRIRKKSLETIERIIKYTEPPKSYLYRDRIKENKKQKDIHNIKEKINSSYVPMDIGIPKLRKERKKSKINDYIHFDFMKLSLFPSGHKNESKFDDRGYYALKNTATTPEIFCSYDVCEEIDFGKKSGEQRLSQLGMDAEEHFYEDLNIFPETSESISRNEGKTSTENELNALSKSTCLVKINEIFSLIRFPIQSKIAAQLPKSSKTDDLQIVNEPKLVKNYTDIECEQSSKRKNQSTVKNNYKNKFDQGNSGVYHIYENHGSSSALYASIEANLNENKVENTRRLTVTQVSVEDYLEPIRNEKDYTDVMFKDSDTSLVNTIRRMFESGFGFRKECEKIQEHPDIDKETAKRTISHPVIIEPPERPLETLQKWTDNLKAIRKPETKTNMADRPLPVPVENEFYYMKVDRLEASKLLEGHADGTFILRPSSQPFHAYTISLVYQNEVHNVGVRRRADGRLALGFSKRAERSFDSIAQLVHHHYRERLVLLVDGRTIGSTRLRPPHD